MTAFHRLATSRDESRYSLVLQPRLALLQHSHQNAIYQDMSVPQIVEKILRERHGMRGQDFLFNLSREYPRREQVLQFGEDDLTFICRLLSEVGIWFRFSADTRLKIDVVEFCDARQNYQRGLSLASVPPSGMHDDGIECVWALESRHQVVEKSVFTRDYNYRDATADMDTTLDVTGGDTTTYGEAYHFADNFLSTGAATNNLEPEAESGAFYARIRHERYLNKQTQLMGDCNAPELAPGMVLNISGADVPAAFQNGVLITAQVCTARRDRSFEIHFDAIPDTGRYGFRPASISRPVMAGTLPARVTSTQQNDLYAHIDKDGRYRVNMLFDRNSWEAGYESLWVRQARPYAGDTWGLHLPLLAGTEVAIAFEDGNPDRPYIAGVLHNSSQPDHVTIQNYRRNVLRTPTNNKLRLDDHRGKESVKLSTDNAGKSQLNLGYLVDAKREKRGEGFELRSDGWGALRAGKGLWISADEQIKAQGQVLEMAPALDTLQQAMGLAQSLGEAVKAARAELAQLEEQKNLMEQSLKDLQQSALMMSAPGGIAQLSPQSIQVSTGASFIQTSGENSDFSVFKKFTVAAGEAISLFARTLGIKLFAGQGKVDIQAQNDAMALSARRDLKITSTDDEVVICADKKITLCCGQTALVVENAGVTILTTGDATVKSASFNLQNPQGYQAQTVELPQGGSCIEQAR